MVSIFVWLLPLDLSGMGDYPSSYATAGIALRVLGALKPHHHDKMETPSVGIMIMYVCIIFLVCFIKFTIIITLLEEPCNSAVDPLNHVPVNAILEVICNVSHLG
jgi:hypothetical protein